MQRCWFRVQQQKVQCLGNKYMARLWFGLDWATTVWKALMKSIIMVGHVLVHLCVHKTHHNPLTGLYLIPAPLAHPSCLSANSHWPWWERGDTIYFSFSLLRSAPFPRRFVPSLHCVSFICFLQGYQLVHAMLARPQLNQLIPAETTRQWSCYAMVASWMKVFIPVWLD